MFHDNMTILQYVCSGRIGPEFHKPAEWQTRILSKKYVLEMPFCQYKNVQRQKQIFCMAEL